MMNQIMAGNGSDGEDASLDYDSAIFVLQCMNSKPSFKEVNYSSIKHPSNSGMNILEIELPEFSSCIRNEVASATQEVPSTS
jgi:hypothetical protein